MNSEYSDFKNSLMPSEDNSAILFYWFQVKIDSIDAHNIPQRFIF